MICYIHLKCQSFLCQGFVLPISTLWIAHDSCLLGCQKSRVQGHFIDGDIQYLRVGETDGPDGVIQHIGGVGDWVPDPVLELHHGNVKLIFHF